jgi:hypothetical protein
MLAQPEQQAEIVRLRGNPPERGANKYDSHPPITDRVAAIRALPENAAATQASADVAGETAVSILRDRLPLLSGTAERMMVKAATGKQAVGWEELVTSAARSQDQKLAKLLEDAATAAAGRLGALPVVFDLVDAAQLRALVGKLPQPRTPQTPAQRAEMFGRFVWASITLELERQGRVRRELSWTEAETLVLDEAGLREDLVAEVKLLVAAAGSGAEASAAPDGAAPTARLRELLKLS